MIGPHLLGRVKDPVDGRDARYRLEAYRQVAAALPARFEVPAPPILDQKDTPQCVTFSGSAYRTAQERRDERRTLYWDEASWYAAAKTIDGIPGDGTSLRAAAEIATKSGTIVSESHKHGEIGQVRKIAAYTRLTSLVELKQSIMATQGAWLGLDWAQSWMDPGPSGVLPPPDAVAGGHAVYARGWLDGDDHLIVDNSWGTSWGKRGVFYLPYQYLQDQLDSHAADVWSIIDVTGDKT